MSKVSIQGDQNGTGDFTIKAPNSNTDRTLTLPDEAGQVLTDVSDIQPQVKTSLNATGDAPMFACRAFVNFDGTGTVSIRESGNVSSITDNGTGDYTVNFTTAMPNSDYAVTSGLGFDATSSLSSSFAHQIFEYTTSSFEILTGNTSSQFRDFLFVNIAVFR